MGSKSDLLRTLAAAGGAGTLPGAMPSFVPKWRRGRASALDPLDTMALYFNTFFM